MGAHSAKNLPAKRGRGRPAGKLNEATKIESREKVAYKRIASLRAQKLLQSATIAAYGSYYIVRLLKNEAGVVYGREIVRAEKEQEKLLTEAVHGEDYLIVEGTAPDWRAGQAILDRAWGKAKETIDVNENVTFTLRSLVESNEAAQLPPLQGEVLRIVQPKEDAPPVIHEQTTQ